MKKKYTVCIILSLVLMFSFSAFAVKPSDKQVNAAKPVTADRTEVLKSRFLNMLNHNFAYGEALDYNEEPVNAHDGEALTGTAVTLFAKNGNSHFGYNIISSNLYFGAEAA